MPACSPRVVEHLHVDVVVRHMTCRMLGWLKRRRLVAALDLDLYSTVSKSPRAEARSIGIDGGPPYRCCLDNMAAGLCLPGQLRKEPALRLQLPLHLQSSFIQDSGDTTGAFELSQPRG